MSQDNDQDPLTLCGFLKIFTGFLVFWGVLVLLAIVIYFPENLPLLARTFHFP